MMTLSSHSSGIKLQVTEQAPKGGVADAHDTFSGRPALEYRHGMKMVQRGPDDMDQLLKLGKLERIDSSFKAHDEPCEDDDAGFIAAAASIGITVSSCSESADACDGDFAAYLQQLCPVTCDTCDGA